MKQLSDRLIWAMKEKSKRDQVEIIPADIAKAASVSDASVNYWLNDANGMKGSKARLVADYLGVNALWLETGEGQPNKIEAVKSTNTSAAELDEALLLLSLYRNATNEGRKAILAHARSVKRRSDSSGSVGSNKP